MVIQLSHMARVEEQGNQRLVVGGGFSLTELIRLSVDQGLGGIEALAGIPGTVGGAVSGNAGAADQQIGQRVVEALVWTPMEDNGVRSWSAQQCDFAYRPQCFDPGSCGGRGHLAVRSRSCGCLTCPPRRGVSPSSAGAQCRRTNAGSVFRNPPQQLAWRLIDDSGMRGVQVGQAQVSPQHANFIVNTGGASADEIYQLIHKVQDAVVRHHGVTLQPEVRLLGSFGEMNEG